MMLNSSELLMLIVNLTDLILFINICAYIFKKQKNIMDLPNRSENYR